MGHVITFAQQKGGAGKTTALANLAAAWTASGRTVALIDLDPQSSLTRWAGLRADPGMDLIDSRDYRAGPDIRAAARNHDRVLVDCPGAASTLLDSAIRESGLVIVPCQPSVMDAWASARVIEVAARLGTPAHILLNRVPPRFGGLEEVLDALGPARDRILAPSLGNRVAFSQAMLTGRTAPEIARRSTAAAEVASLLAEIDAILAAA